MKNQAQKKVGEAYAFFDCRASKQEIERELPYIRDSVRTPNRLELSLTEGINLECFESPELREMVLKAKQEGRRYLMKATCADLSNQQTADETADILNQAYQSPLYCEGERFIGEIVYEEGGRCISRK